MMTLFVSIVCQPLFKLIVHYVTNTETDIFLLSTKVTTQANSLSRTDKIGSFSRDSCICIFEQRVNYLKLVMQIDQ